MSRPVASSTMRPSPWDRRALGEEPSSLSRTPVAFASASVPLWATLRLPRMKAEGEGCVSRALPPGLTLRPPPLNATNARHNLGGGGSVFSASLALRVARCAFVSNTAQYGGLSLLLTTICLSRARPSPTMSLLSSTKGLCSRLGLRSPASPTPPSSATRPKTNPAVLFILNSLC